MRVLSYMFCSILVIASTSLFVKYEKHVIMINRTMP